METQSNVEKRLEKVERAIIEIQNKIIDTDSIMTEEDFEALISYRKEKYIKFKRLLFEIIRRVYYVKN